ncbi:FeoB-associated Cys-rich membrane protein [Aestuariivivens sediminis]|nr:FeoB-associated Cys-rich membrane protein [Aestuariivivens sediminis]
MTHIIQNILVAICIVLALLFLVKKFFWKTKSKKSCHGNDDCGCH